MANDSLLPLNVGIERYKDVVERSLPNKFNAYITLFKVRADFPLPVEPQEEVILNSVINALHQKDSRDANRFGIVAPPSMTIHTFATLEFDFLAELDNDKLRAWTYDGLFLDLAFTSDPEPDDIQKLQTFIGMRFLNLWQLKYGSLAPEDLQPLSMANVSGKLYHGVIGDVFDNGPGLWTDELFQLRTAMLVLARATLMGRNAEAEWERFVKAGGTSHLDYPILCP